MNCGPRSASFLGHAAFLCRVITEVHESLLKIIVRNAIRLKEIVDNMANINHIQRRLANFRHRLVSRKRVIAFL
jgi:hypothetical protein